MKEKLSDILKPETGCISEDILFRYAEGKLPSEEMRRVEEHLADCDFCSDALEGIMMGDPEKSQAAIEEIKNKINERVTVRKLFPVRRILKIAAVIILFAVSGWFVNLIMQKPSGKIFTDQFQPYPAPQNGNSVDSAPPSVSERKMSSDEEKKPVNPSASSAVKQEEEKNQHAEKKSPQALTPQTKATEESPVQTITESAEAPAGDDVIQSYKNKDSSLNFSKSEGDAAKSAPGIDKQSRATSLNEVVTTDAFSSAQRTLAENFNSGMEYYKGNRFSEALTEFQLILQQEPGNAEANFYSGVSSLALNHPDEALKYLQT